jgi:hypothetical protein
MTDGVHNRDVNLRMMLQSRGPGQYGYVIGRPDLEEWGEPSLETFESLAEADDAGRGHENSGSPTVSFGFLSRRDIPNDVDTVPLAPH